VGYLTVDSGYQNLTPQTVRTHTLSGKAISPYINIFLCDIKVWRFPILCTIHFKAHISYFSLPKIHFWHSNSTVPVFSSWKWQQTSRVRNFVIYILATWM